MRYSKRDRVHAKKIDTLTKVYGSVDIREKVRDLNQSYDKNPYTNRNVKRAMCHKYKIKQIWRLIELRIGFNNMKHNS